MKLYVVLILFFASFALCNLVNRVRTIDHASYIVAVITKVVNQLEDKHWGNLKLSDVSQPIDELVLGQGIKGDIHYTNGFLVSIEGVDVLQNSVQQGVTLNSDEKAQVRITGTLRMHNVAIGYDVQAALQDGNRHYTVIHVHPTITFAFTILKLVDGDDITVTVTGDAPTNRNLPSFLPVDYASDVLTTKFDTTMAKADIEAWGPEVFQPLASVAAKEVPFPELCFNCAA